MNCNRCGLKKISLHNTKTKHVFSTPKKDLLEKFKDRTSDVDTVYNTIKEKINNCTACLQNIEKNVPDSEEQKYIYWTFFILADAKETKIFDYDYKLYNMIKSQKEFQNKNTLLKTFRDKIRDSLPAQYKEVRTRLKLPINDQHIFNSWNIVMFIRKISSLRRISYDGIWDKFPPCTLAELFLALIIGLTTDIKVRNNFIGIVNDKVTMLHKTADVIYTNLKKHSMHMVFKDILTAIFNSKMSRQNSSDRYKSIMAHIESTHLKALDATLQSFKIDTKTVDKVEWPQAPPLPRKGKSKSKSKSTQEKKSSESASQLTPTSDQTSNSSVSDLSPQTISQQSSLTSSVLGQISNSSQIHASNPQSPTSSTLSSSLQSSQQKLEEQVSDDRQSQLSSSSVEILMSDDEIETSASPPSPTSSTTPPSSTSSTSPTSSTSSTSSKRNLSGITTTSKKRLKTTHKESTTAGSKRRLDEQNRMSKRQRKNKSVATEIDTKFSHLLEECRNKLKAMVAQSNIFNSELKEHNSELRYVHNSDALGAFTQDTISTLKPA